MRGVKVEKIGLGLLVALSLLVTAVDLSWAESYVPRRRHDGLKERAILRKLDLSPQQKRELVDLMREHRSRVKDLRKKMFSARERLRQVLLSGKEQELESVVEELVQRYKDVVKERVRFTLKVKEVLTKEQFEKWMRLRRRVGTRFGRGWLKKEVGYEKE